LYRIEVPHQLIKTDQLSGIDVPYHEDCVKLVRSLHAKVPFGLFTRSFCYMV